MSTCGLHPVGGRTYRENIWDHAAGHLILSEAGGQVCITAVCASPCARARANVLAFGCPGAVQCGGMPGSFHLFHVILKKSDRWVCHSFAPERHGVHGRACINPWKNVFGHNGSEYCPGDGHERLAFGFHTRRKTRQEYRSYSDTHTHTHTHKDT